MAIGQQPESVIYEDFSNVNQCMGIAGLYQYTARSLAVQPGWSGGSRHLQCTQGSDSIFQQRMGRYNKEMK